HRARGGARRSGDTRHAPGRDRRADRPPRVAWGSGGRSRQVVDRPRRVGRARAGEHLGLGPAGLYRGRSLPDSPGPGRLARHREIRYALDRTLGRREIAMSAAKLIIGLAVVVLLPGLAWAATPDGLRLEGRLPDNTPLVSIDQPRGTILDALSATAKQTGWSLVVTAPESVTTRPLTLQVSKRPAAEVLDLILEAGSLRASFADGVLRVRPDATTATADSWRARRRERLGHRGSERAVFGRSLTVNADEIVDKAVAIGGSVTIAGRVRHDAVAVGGS